MSGPVGYRVSGSEPKSFTASLNRRPVKVPAIHRFRRTDTVSTSARSGTDTSPAAASRDRAATPVGPSSPTTFARTEASTTINSVDPHQGLRALSQVPLSRLGDARSGPAPGPLWVCERGVSARRQGNFAEIDLAPPPVAAGLRGHRQGDPVLGHSACYHYDIRFQRCCVMAPSSALL